jgi:outer membrane lipoprotein-sorting protein
MTVLATILALGAAPVAVSLQAAPPAAAVETAPVESGALSAADRQDILTSVAKSMADVKTARGAFTQMSADYSVITGEFALKRPGKVRFDYDDPTPVLIVSNGTTVAIQDSDLETTDRVPLGATPLKILLDDKLDFDAETDVVDVARYDGLLGVTVRDANGEMDGTLTLLFRDSDKELLGWRTIDGTGGITSVELSKVEYGKKLSPRLFIMDDFEDED